MTQHQGGLNSLLNQFVHEVEVLCGNSVYFRKLEGRRWGVYKHPDYTGNICNAIERTQRDKDFSRYRLPHLKIVTGNNLVLKAGAKPELVVSERWHAENAAYWCIGIGDSVRLTKVAREISKLYPYVK